MFSSESGIQKEIFCEKQIKIFGNMIFIFESL